MLSEFTPPSWATWVIVSGDAADGSKANMKMVKDRDQADGERRWGLCLCHGPHLENGA
jgi:hypothetical protein